MTKPNDKHLDLWAIEDNEEMRATLVEVTDSDAEMRCTPNFTRCEEALEALQHESPPQVILMDIGLPGMSGIEGVRRIRAISPATQILMLLVCGKPQKQIAETLFLSPLTIATHIKNIYVKLHVHSRSEAVAKALKEHLF